MAGADGISMVPSEVAGYRAPSLGLNNPGQQLQSGLDEGKKYAATDGDVTKEFFDFVKAANEGMQAFEGTAVKAAHGYAAADDMSALTIDGVLPD
ncbi:hypothetical protein AB0425_25160 [Actinosynnema sp. NPDC051121]